MHETEQRRRLCGAAGSGLPRLGFVPPPAPGYAGSPPPPATAELPPK